MTALDDALRHARAATITPDELLSRLHTGRYGWNPAEKNAVQRTELWKALTSLYAAAHPAPVPAPPPAPAQPSLFSGKGLFTTSNANSASNLPCAWVALQQDPEGDPAPVITNNPARICWWQARPTQAVATEANARDVPYIGQAENQEQLDACLALNVTVEKALVGDPSAWTQTGFDEAARQGWSLLLEFYKNAMPWLTAPDAKNYPLFRNVVFGTYDASSEHPGGGRVSVAEYRAIWPGPFSCWPAETMTDADRAAFNVA